MKPHINRRIAIAPMMDLTDRHFRYFARLMSQHVLLYTEMLTTGAVLHGDRDRLLAYAPQEHPLAIQLGGSDPGALVLASRIAEDYGYAEVNLNVGCPSDRVQSGAFGACLMKTPELVAECVAKMQAAISIPVTVKTRIGVDNQDTDADLTRFVSLVREAPCRTFILHARKAWLQGLSPKENREIPPLNYSRVYRLKEEFPDLEIIINGGIQQAASVQAHWQHVDGVMIGREACHRPYFIAQFDGLVDATVNPVLPTRREVIQAYLPYVEEQFRQGVPLRMLCRPLVGLYRGERCGKLWRRSLNEWLQSQPSELGFLFDSGS